MHKIHNGGEERREGVGLRFVLGGSAAGRRCTRYVTGAGGKLPVHQRPLVPLIELIANKMFVTVRA